MFIISTFVHSSHFSTHHVFLVCLCFLFRGEKISFEQLLYNVAKSRIDLAVWSKEEQLLKKETDLFDISWYSSNTTTDIVPVLFDS